MRFKFILTAAMLSLTLALSAQEAARDSSGRVRRDYRDQFITIDYSRFSSRWSIETNVVDLGFLGTINGAAQFAVAQHFTVLGQARYNNWTYNKGQENQLESRQRTFALGTRFWPWYTYSGWWIEAKGQYQEYNRGGIGTLQTEEGDAWGGALSAGYSLQISKWFNIDFGLGLWAGTTKYTVYACPHCGKKLDEGNKFFILPNEVTIAAMFVF